MGDYVYVYQVENLALLKNVVLGPSDIKVSFGVATGNTSNFFLNGVTYSIDFTIFLQAGSIKLYIITQNLKSTNTSINVHFFFVYSIFS